MSVLFRITATAFAAGLTLLVACGGNTAGTGTGADGGPTGGPFGVPTLHIPAGTSCRTTRPAGNEPNGYTCPDAGFSGCCSSDAECTDGQNGRCTITGNGGPHCTYDECTTSNDCATGKSCGCGDVNQYSFNTCVPSNCRTDADCGANGYCSPTLDFTCGTYGGEYTGVYCHTPKDQCMNDSDCGNATNARCSYNPESSRWECATSMCAG